MRLFSILTTLFLSIMMLGLCWLPVASAISVDDFTSGFFMLSSTGDLVTDTGPCGCITPNRTASLQSNAPGESSSAEMVGGAAFVFLPAGGAYFSLEYGPMVNPLDLTVEGDSLDITMSTAQQGAFITVILSDGFNNAEQMLVTPAVGASSYTLSFPLYYFQTVNLAQITSIKVEMNSTVPGDYYFTDISVDFTAMADVNWGRSLFLETTGGFEHPLVRVGFTPQPEPPGHWFPGLDLSDSTRPIFSLAADSMDTLQFFIGLEPASSEPFAFSAPGFPDGAGHFEFDMEGPGSVLTIILDITSSSSGLVAPGTWVGFTPQPEPPGHPAFAGQQQGFNFDVAYAKNQGEKVPDTFFVAMRILEDGTPYDFSEVTADVPAMSPWSMMALLLAFSGLIPVGARLRRRR